MSQPTPASKPIYSLLPTEVEGFDSFAELALDMRCSWNHWADKLCHLNKGHSAFAFLERARTFMEEAGQPFEVELAVLRAGNLFTTYTAVATSFDRFASDIIEQYLLYVRPFPAFQTNINKQRRNV